MAINDILFELSTNNRKYQFMICHKIPERSIVIKGKPILCYRCFGIYFAFGITLIFQIVRIVIGVLFVDIVGYYVLITGEKLLNEFLLVILLHIPLIVDGGLQSILTIYTSNNLLRFLTGFIAGIGQVAFYLFLGSLFLNFIQIL